MLNTDPMIREEQDALFMPNLLAPKTPAPEKKRRLGLEVRMMKTDALHKSG